MTPPSDDEILARFRRRFAGIDQEVPRVPAFRLAPRLRPSAGLLAVPVLVVVGFLIVGVPLLGGQPSTAARPSGSPSAAIPTAASPAAAGPSELDLAVALEPLPVPNGVTLSTGLMPNRHYTAQLSASGRVVRSWSLTEDVAFRQVFDPGSYVLTVWRYSVVDSVETGARMTGPPEDACFIDLILDPSMPKVVDAVFPRGAAACKLEVRRFGSAPVAKSPSP